MDAYIEPEGCELYCEMCAPDGAEAYPDGGGEADYPQSCGGCQAPLDNPLTEYGVRYVLDAARKELKRGREEYNKVLPCYNGTYYEGSRHVEIIRDWVKPLTWYGLARAESRFVKHFLSWTAR